MAEACDRLVHLGGKPVPYLHWSCPTPNAPVAVLLHGLTSSARTWLDLGTHLSSRFEVYAVDQRGHGRAARIRQSPPDSRFSPDSQSDRDAKIDRFALDAIEFLGALDLRPTILLGHSWGAAAAVVAAAILSIGRSDRAPKAMILEDPVHAVGTERQRAMAARMLAWQRLDAGGLRAELKKTEPNLTDQQLSDRIEELRATDSGLLVRVGADISERSLLPLLAELDCPVLLLLADKSLSGVFDDEALERARPLLPAGSRAVRVPGAPHVVHRAAPSRTALEIDTFLRTLI